MGSEHPNPGRESALLACAFLAFVAGGALLVARHLDAPGLFYDEVIQAEPAVQFLLPDGRPSETPGFTTTRLWGGWFPLMTQPYMGALKSQLLIPVFAVFGASAETLRLTTLIWGWLGLGLAMVFTRQIAGLGAAVLAGAFLASDPGFLLVSRHDWGAVTLGLILRCGGLVLATWGWRRRRTGLLVAAGILFGVGLFNKIDFAIFLVAAGIALLAAAPATLWHTLRHEPRRALPLCAGFAIGATPLLVAVTQVWEATRILFRQQGGAETNWDIKFHVLVSMMDGSYFHRMMLTGGDFGRMPAVEGAAESPFLWIFAASVIFLALRAWLRPERSDAERAQVFVAVTAVMSGAGFLLMPGAERIHHAMNALPFAHLTVALAAVAVWRLVERPGLPRALLHATAAAVTAAVLAGNLVVCARTLATIHETGGKGRWSNALADFGRELEAESGVAAVSLDWGLYGPLRFSSRNLTLTEAIWKMSRPGLRQGPWVYEGNAQTVYLLYPPEYALFDFGASLLREIETLPPGSAQVRRHADASGDLAFLSVRFAGPHRLVYDRDLEVRLR